MSDEQTANEQSDQGGQTDEPAEPEQPDTGSDDGGDASAEVEKWKALARKHEQQAKKNADAAKRLSELEDSQKSEIEKVTDKATQAEQRAAEAEAKALRFEVAADKAPEGMAAAKVRKLAQFLTGTTQEELEEQADEILALIGDADGGEKPSRRPKERLKSGAASDSEPEPDPKKIADSVMRGGL